MKLTNLQLQVVTKNILGKINTKKEEFKTTPEYAEIEAQVKLDNHYTQELAWTQRKEEINDLYTQLNAEIAQIDRDYKTLNGLKFGSVHYDVDTLEKKIQKKIFDKVSERFPSQEQIETDIVLSTIDGNADFINSILAKYNLV